MKKLALLFVLIFTLIAFTEMFSQGIPETVNYQGILKDALGNIVPDGNYNITFKLYDSVVGGTVLWTEVKVVNIIGGIINTQLGSVVLLNSNLFIGATWLGITIESGSELTPRIALTSAPYSFMTMDVADGRVVKSLNGLKDNINLVAGSNITITPTGNDLTIAATGGGGGGTVTQVNTGSGLTGGPITTTGTISIANDGVTNTMLQNNSVTTSKITDGTIVTSDLSDNSVTTAKIVDGTIASGDLANNSITAAKIVDGTITSADIGSSQVLKSLNTLKDNVTLVAGSNITITPSGQNLTIASTAGGIGGSGNANYLPLFTGTTTLGNSVIYQTGGNIGIGTTTPTAKLELSGSDALINGLTIGRGTGNISGNSAFGYRAIYSNTTGYSNTANGSWSLYFNTEGDNNSAIGSYALYSNTTGNNNTANGYRALYSNTTGYENTATGVQALYHNTEGFRNTANGLNALTSNTTGNYNTANGFGALFHNTEGVYNTAIGMYSLYNNTTANDNTGIGYRAGDYYTFSQGTFLGKGAYPNTNGYTNVMGLGYNARPNASNQVRIGNSLVTSIGGYAGWTNLSDGRYKLAVNENVKGLEFILKLRPVTYQLDVNKIAQSLNEDQQRDENGNIINSPTDIDIKSRNEKSQIVYTGFVAQEVEKAANEVGFNFSGIDAPKNENDFYGLRYAEFVVPLVKAVQEQQKIIEDLNKRIEELERR
jgi:trimeric autotransporter adhesin